MSNRFGEDLQENPFYLFLQSNPKCEEVYANAAKNGNLILVPISASLEGKIVSCLFSLVCFETKRT